MPIQLDRPIVHRCRPGLGAVDRPGGHDQGDRRATLMSEFFEAIWNDEGIGDGGDLQEALQAYVAVKPDDNDWIAACARCICCGLGWVENGDRTE